MVSTCTDAEHLSHVPIEAGSIVTAEEIRQSLKGVELDKPYLCMLVLISTVWAQRTKRALTRVLIGGAQPVEGWWAPVAQHTYKKKRWGSGAHSPKFVALCPINRNPSRSGDMLKRREAPPVPATAPRHLRLHHATPPPLRTLTTTCHGGRRGHI